MKTTKKEPRSWVTYKDKNCIHCKVAFSNASAQSQKKWSKVKFCSLQCNAAYKKQTVEIKYCKNCKKEIPKGLHDKVSRYKNKQYCSKKCARSIFWKGGISKDFGRYSNARRARLLGNGGDHTTEEWELLKESLGRKCVCCNKSESAVLLTRDHIVPLIAGGSNDIDNIQPLCKSCNSSKSTKIVNFVKYNVCMV